VVFCCYCGCLEFFLLVFRLLVYYQWQKPEMVVLHMKLKTGTQNKVKSPHISFLVSLVIILDSYLSTVWIDCQLQLCFSVYSFLNSKLIKDIAVFFYLMLLPSFILYIIVSFFLIYLVLTWLNSFGSFICKSRALTDCRKGKKTRKWKVWVSKNK
jgi:hypothetical protein